jgi:hypothetical protein
MQLCKRKRLGVQPIPKAVLGLWPCNWLRRKYHPIVMSCSCEIIWFCSLGRSLDAGPRSGREREIYRGGWDAGSENKYRENQILIVVEIQMNMGGLAHKHPFNFAARAKNADG